MMEHLTLTRQQARANMFDVHISAGHHDTTVSLFYILQFSKQGR